MSLSPSVAGRLAFIRYLHYLGVEQSHLPEPSSSASVLMFHDAVESFLLLAAEHLGASPPRDFIQYWDTLSPTKLPGGVSLAVKQGMARLNRVRVNLKHHGVQPGTAAIAQAVEDTATFFAANTQLVFGVDYDQVSMADVIEQDRVRDLVQTAEAAAAAGDHLAAMVALADAQDMLLTPRDGRSSTASPLRFGRTLGRWMQSDKIRQALTPAGPNAPDPNASTRREVAQYLSELANVVKELQAAARLAALGLDYAAFQRFERLTPRPVNYSGGRREYRAPKGYAPSPTDFAFCLQFVVTTSLRLTEAHAHLQPPAWVSGQRTQWETVAEGTHQPDGYL